MRSEVRFHQEACAQFGDLVDLDAVVVHQVALGAQHRLAFKGHRKLMKRSITVEHIHHVHTLIRRWGSRGQTPAVMSAVGGRQKRLPDTVVTMVCLRCGSRDVVEIVYGFPAPSLSERASTGSVALGGCELGIGHDNPNRLCRVWDHRWREGPPRTAAGKAFIKVASDSSDDEIARSITYQLFGPPAR